ncbi:MAG: DUF6048 family protein [Cytophagales bacterium]|nr:DUF6048 family protein [Cytophagales bacterium]MDW8383692.1 DUF6048 family protein [Flammeovirgaceae bacterium]
MRFFIFFFLLPLVAHSQNLSSEFIVSPSSKKRTLLPISGIRIGADILLPLTPFLSKPENKRNGYEICSEILLSNRFFIPIDWGYASIDRSYTGTRSVIQNNQVIARVPSQTYQYHNSGTYWRIGLDYNFLHHQTQDEALFVGGRIAFVNFQHQLKYTYYDAVLGIFSEDMPITVHRAWLGEAVAGTKVRFFHQFFVSTLLRIKIRLYQPETSLFSINDIPCFGANNDAINIWIGWQLMYRIKTKR